MGVILQHAVPVSPYCLAYFQVMQSELTILVAIVLVCVTAGLAVGGSSYREGYHDGDGHDAQEDAEDREQEDIGSEGTGGGGYDEHSGDEDDKYCRAVGPWAGRKMSAWCIRVCHKNPEACPADGSSPICSEACKAGTMPLECATADQCPDPCGMAAGDVCEVGRDSQPCLVTRRFLRAAKCASTSPPEMETPPDEPTKGIERLLQGGWWWFGNKDDPRGNPWEDTGANCISPGFFAANPNLLLGALGLRPGDGYTTYISIGGAGTTEGPTEEALNSALRDTGAVGIMYRFQGWLSAEPPNDPVAQVDLAKTIRQRHATHPTTGEPLVHIACPVCTLPSHTATWAGGTILNMYPTPSLVGGDTGFDYIAPLAAAGATSYTGRRGWTRLKLQKLWQDVHAQGWPKHRTFLTYSALALSHALSRDDTSIAEWIRNTKHEYKGVLGWPTMDGDHGYAANKVCAKAIGYGQVSHNKKTGSPSGT